MYCNVSEAFDTSFDEKLEKFNKVYNGTHQHLQINPGNSSGTRGNNMSGTHGNNLSGNLSNERGTTIKELRCNGMSSLGSLGSIGSSMYDDNSESILSFPSSNGENDSFDFEFKKAKGCIDHDRYINKFIKSIIDDCSDIASMSSGYDETYNHIKKCKYCKSQLGSRMAMKCNKDVPDDHKESYTDINKSGVKEIFLMILFGIFIIFVLDLFVKLGKSTKLNRNLGGQSRIQ